MIKYSLTCKDCDLIFESWFASSKEFEKLKKRNFLNCQRCDSLNIDKSLMTPSFIKKNKNQDKVASHQLKKYKQIKKTINVYRDFVKENFNYVGDKFAYEARSIHYNTKKKRKGIYGTASKQDLKELKEEGIDAQLIPWIENNEN